MPTKIRIPKSSNTLSYEIFIGKGLISRAGEIIEDMISASTDEELKKRSFLIISGKTTSSLYLDIIKKSLEAKNYDIKSIIIGEEKICDIGNRTPIVVGGNRFSHLLKKLKPYIYIPTTLLGMSHTAVANNTLLVISDINLLKTLGYKYLMSGYSEIAKHAIIKDLEFFEWLEPHGRSIFDGDENARTYAIRKSCEIKGALLSNPEKEKLLRFGHLYADAIRIIAKNRLLHGEVISIGMVAAFKLATKLKLCDIEEYKRARRHLKSMSLPVELYADYWDAGELVNTIDLDAPAVLPYKISDMTIFHNELYHKTLLHVANELISTQ